jgi:predicted phosphodiesterase
MRIGLISDTHALVRPQAIEYLRGSDAILHAGDIVEPAILDVLAAMAPLTAVRGNNDRGPWADRLPLTAVRCSSAASASTCCTTSPT